MQVKTNSGYELLDESKINEVIQSACENLEYVEWSEVASRTKISWYDGITTDELAQATILAARELIEEHPNYEFVAARLLLRKLKKEIKSPYTNFKDYICTAINTILDVRLFQVFDLDRLQIALQTNRDLLFRYKGIAILYDRYLLRDPNGNLMEQPQWMWMRVAMGIALGEKENHTEWAIKFYNIISQFDYMPSTPTLFNAGTKHPQMASCYVQDVADSIEGIFEAYADQGSMSKWAGGIGTNWSKVRATGTKIKGTNGESTGVIPWLKIQNDIAVAVNQGGKRKGAHCVYLESWHVDVEDFLDLRKNIGDDRRRTHDMHTALWHSDLFMRRVKDNAEWTLFCPTDVPELTETYGLEFEMFYREAERRGLGRKTIKAQDLWKKMLIATYETGHPWHTFKDACNRANPLISEGIIHSSNLCTEITLNTAPDETAVCNLGSINLENHVDTEDNCTFDYQKLISTTKLAVRMLDNIIDTMFYPTEKAKLTNQANRPIGLGIMGWQNVLYRIQDMYALQLAKHIQEKIKDAALETSQQLAKERGAYPNWGYSNQPIMQRNSYLLAIAPTATISHIVGTSPSIEPLFSNIFTESKLSGEFTYVNPFLVEDLIKLDLWTQDIRNKINVADGSIQNILEIPEQIRYKYRTSFEIDQKELINLAAVRQKYVCQSQSLNLYVSSKSGKELSDLYMYAWEKGLKTTYYLRTKGASSVEKSTIDPNIYGKTHFKQVDDVQICKLEAPDCEACQ